MIDIKNRLGLAFLALAVVAFSAFALGGAERSAAAVTTLELALTGAEENPPVTNSTGTAFARLTFDDQTSVLTYALTVSGLSPELVIAAHIHRGPVGVNGPIIHNLSLVGFTQVSGSITLPAGDVTDLRAGNLYVNVHSVQHPGGFARAQIYLDPAVSITMRVQGAVAAWNRHDANAFIGYFTESGLIETFGFSSLEEAQMFLPEFIGDPPIVFQSLTGVSVSGREATGALQLAVGIAVERTQDRFILDTTGWKIDGESPLPVPIPSNVTAVEMRLQEYAFVYDRDQVASGNVGFRIANSGRELHEIVLTRLAANVNFMQAIQSDDLPAGVEVLANAGPFEPGEQATLVFTQPLSAGRYGLVCFISSPAGVPHAFLGMLSEFTVAGGGTTVRPPSTGDAGLLDSTSSYRALLLVVAFLSLSLGGGMLALGRRRA